MHLWATDFRVFTVGHRVPFQHFLYFQCRLRLNQSGFFTRGGIYSFLLCPTHIFFKLCNHETHFGRYAITELTTHSPRLINYHNHAHTPNIMRFPRAYAMQNANACISCYMYNEHYVEQFIIRTSCQVPWIIISKTYNLHPFMLIYMTHIYQHIYKTFNMLFNFQQ